MKKMSFNKMDSWDGYTFYSIIEKDGEKYIKFVGSIDRVPSVNHSYLEWVVNEFDDDCEVKLEDILEWDIYYQMEKLFKSINYDYSDSYEPADAFDMANGFVRGIDGSGSEELMLLDLTSNVECGNYFGC